MIRERLNKIIGTRTFMIVFSIMASIALWLYVAYAENGDIPVTLTGVKVEFIGAEQLTENNLVVTNVDQRTLTVRLVGKRNTVTRLSGADITATVDLTQIIKNSPTAGINQLEYELNYPDDIKLENISEVRAYPSFVTVTVEKMVSKTIQVQGVFDGKIEEGYQAEAMEFDPETITVYGPEVDVSRVSYALVSLEQESISKTVEQQLPVTLMDADGIEVVSESITLSQDVVNVRLPIIMVKEVPLAVNFTYGASAKDDNISYKIEPETITLSGDSDLLTDYNQVLLGTIDLTDFAQTSTETFQIILPNEFSNLTGETTATVKVEVLGQKTQRLSANNISVRNKPEGLTTTIITQSLDVTIRGSEASIDAITADNIRIVADMVEVGNATGTISVPAKIYIDGYTDVDPIGDYKVTVSITD